MSLISIARLATAQTWSISPENFDGSKGGGAMARTGTGASCARDLGPGWKISPSVDIRAGEEHVLADIHRAAVITHMWMTTHRDHWRTLILRAWWDGANQPAIEVPLGDFFGQGWGSFAQLSSQPVAVNPHGGFNCYWPMPFASAARITVQNIGDAVATVYYQITFETGGEQKDLGYLHTQFHRSNPLPYRQVHPVLDRVSGHGKYVGTYIAWGVNNPGWWGEGEIKFYVDGDQEFPTICGTGTEDYFGGAWNFDVPGQGYTAFTTPYLGLHQILRPDGLYRSQQRFGMYRWHIADPIHFHTDAQVSIQALGWQSGHRYRPLTDDIASVAYYYLDSPISTHPDFPPRDYLEIAGAPMDPIG